MRYTVEPHELIHGWVYELSSRNLQYGVWDATVKGFIGIREKFDHRYLFVEYEYDLVGPPYGTAMARRPIGPVGTEVSVDSEDIFNALDAIESSADYSSFDYVRRADYLMRLPREIGLARVEEEIQRLRHDKRFFDSKLKHPGLYRVFNDKYHGKMKHLRDTRKALRK